MGIHWILNLHKAFDNIGGRESRNSSKLCTHCDIFSHYREASKYSTFFSKSPFPSVYGVHLKNKWLDIDQRWCMCLKRVEKVRLEKIKTEKTAGKKNKNKNKTLSSGGGSEVEQWTDNRTLSILVGSNLARRQKDFRSN